MSANQMERYLCCCLGITLLDSWLLNKASDLKNILVGSGMKKVKGPLLC